MRCVIVGAAAIANYEKIKTYLKADDFFVFCDGGLSHAAALRVTPNLIVGDFDSHPCPDPATSAEIIKLPREKDDTDSFFAVKEAVRRGFKDLLLLGVIRQRFDHSMVNISILLYLKKLGLSALLLDDYSEMEVIGGDLEDRDNRSAAIPDSFSYFSLLCIAGDVSNVTIRNAKFPLEKGSIKSDYQYATSNEVIPGKTAQVSVENGYILLIKVF